MTVRKNTNFNRIKADFSDIYNLDDPREYFRSLSSKDYIIPHLARDVFIQVISNIHQNNTDKMTILDVGCSYGLNAALLKRSVSWDTMVQRQTLPELMRVPSALVRQLDRRFFESWPERPGIRVVGIDVAERAVSYGEAIGALDAGFGVDLEVEDPPPALARELANIDLVVSTGCVGYVTHKTFARLLQHANAGRALPWVASFVLRAVDYTPIANTLEAVGLQTEKLEGISFVQRRFADITEMEETITLLEARGIDPSLHEARGLMHAEFYLSRPAAEIKARPLNQMIHVAAGTNKPHQIAMETLGGSIIGSERPAA